jgi:sensor domain CHASE-containing protein
MLLVMLLVTSACWCCCLLMLLLLVVVLLLLLQLPESVKDLDDAALAQHAGKVQSAVMMAVNEHNTVAQAVSARMWQLAHVQQPSSTISVAH